MIILHKNVEFIQLTEIHNEIGKTCVKISQYNILELDCHQCVTVLKY